LKDFFGRNTEALPCRHHVFDSLEEIPIAAYKNVYRKCKQNVKKKHISKMNTVWLCIGTKIPSS
jgi:hypothetical protein